MASGMSMYGKHRQTKRVNVFVKNIFATSRCCSRQINEFDHTLNMAKFLIPDTRKHIEFSCPSSAKLSNKIYKKIEFFGLFNVPIKFSQYSAKITIILYIRKMWKNDMSFYKKIEFDAIAKLFYCILKQ